MISKTKKNYKKKIKSYTKKQKIKYKHNTIDDYLYNPNSSYPFYKLYASKDTIKERFNNLKKFNPLIKNYNYNFRVLIKIPELLLQYHDTNNLINKKILLFGNNNFLKYDWISDYFQDHERIKCIRTSTDKNMNPYLFWNNKKNRPLILKEYKKKYGTLFKYEHLDDIIYNLTHSCSSFRPTIIVALLKHFNLFNKNINMLDISAGWGDRLIGAIASNVNFYFATDPNKNLQKGYNDIIKFFNADKSKFKIKTEPFQKVNIEKPPNNKMYDIMITSPPYFNLEIYDNDNTNQSISGKSINQWLNDFLKPSLKKVWISLNEHGYLVLIINNIRTKNNETNKLETLYYIENAIKFLNNIINSDYRGCLAYGDYIKGTNKIRNPQPMWIWRKKLSITNIIKSIKIKDLSDIKLSNDNKIDYLLNKIKKTKHTTIIYKFNFETSNFNKFLSFNNDSNKRLKNIIKLIAYLIFIAAKNNKYIIFIHRSSKLNNIDLNNYGISKCCLNYINCVKEKEYNYRSNKFINWKKLEKNNNVLIL